MTDAEFEGRPAIRLDYTDEKQGKIVVHLDRKTMQFLHQEAERSPEVLSRDYVAVKRVSRVEYRDVGDKRLPTRWESYRVKPKHPKMLELAVDITSYEPYTPTADELDLEKQFCVKPIAHDPRPADRPAGGAPARRAWPLYAAAAALLVAAVGLAVVVARRRRRARV